MNQEQLEQIKNHPSFIQMQSKKSKLGLIFTVLTLIVYFGYIIMVGANPDVFATPVAAGKITTIGIYWGLFVIFFSIIITGIYVYKANGEFDALTKKVIDDMDLKQDKPPVVTNAH